MIFAGFENKEVQMRGCQCSQSPSGPEVISVSNLLESAMPSLMYYMVLIVLWAVLCTLQSLLWLLL